MSDYEEKIREAFNSPEFRKCLLSAMEAAPNDDVLDAEQLDSTLAAVLLEVYKEISPETRARWDEVTRSRQRQELLRRISECQERMQEESTAGLTVVADADRLQLKHLSRFDRLERDLVYLRERLTALGGEDV